MRKFIATLKDAVGGFLEDECTVSGAALAYYTAFSLPPLLVLVFQVLGFLGVAPERIDEAVGRQIGVRVPAPADVGQAADPREEREGDRSFTSVAQRQTEVAQPIAELGPVSTFIGLFVLVFSATGVFAQLQRALNKAWNVQPDPQKSVWRNLLIKRLLSFGMILVMAFLLLVSLVLTTLVDEGLRLLLGKEPGPAAIALGVALNSVISFAVATLLFVAIYRILPDADMKWRDTWVGAAVTAFLFVMGKTCIGWYLQGSQVGSAWGSAAASMIALLVWVYFTAIIVLFGAELTQAWARHYGRGIRPQEGAVRSSST